MAEDNRVVDRILVGGIVHRFDGQPAAQAVAIAGGRVAGIGTDEQMVALAGPQTEVIDLAGRAVLPGINDSHLHATWLGTMWPRTLMGAMGGSAPIADVPQEPLSDGGQQRAAILRAMDVVLALGITSVTEPGLGPGEDAGATGAFGTSVVEQYRQLAAAGQLPVRVTVLSLFGELDGGSSWSDFERGLARVDHSTPDADFLRFAGVKIFADGIPPMRTAYTHRCYLDAARPELFVSGAHSQQREENMRKMILAAHAAGLQVGVHATGDRAIEVMLEAVAQARARQDVDLGHYVVHGDLVSDEQLARMAHLGVGLNTQPGIPMRTAELVDAALGEGTAVQAWPLQAALDAGVLLCLSSDSPVLSPDWREHIAAADAWMGPAGDRQQRMRALLEAYTVAPAIQDGLANWKGTISPGKVADLCVLAQDPMRMAPADLPHVDIDLTIVAGGVAYDRRATPAADHHRPAS